MRAWSFLNSTTSAAKKLISLSVFFAGGSAQDLCDHYTSLEVAICMRLRQVVQIGDACHL